MRPQEVFQTTDIALAAYLVLRGYSLAGVRHVSQNRSIFQFAGDPEGRGEVLKFFNRKAKVEPNSLLDQVKSLKAMASSR